MGILLLFIWVDLRNWKLQLERIRRSHLVQSSRWWAQDPGGSSYCLVCQAYSAWADPNSQVLTPAQSFSSLQHCVTTLCIWLHGSDSCDRTLIPSALGAMAGAPSGQGSRSISLFIAEEPSGMKMLGSCSNHICPQGSKDHPYAIALTHLLTLTSVWSPHPYPAICQLLPLNWHLM